MRTTISLLLISGFIQIFAQNPEKNWMIYKNPEDAGFSVEKLAIIDSLYNTMDFSSLMIVQNGKVVYSLGNCSRRFKSHSIRKAILNILYGVHYGEGLIDTDKTLKELEIDDRFQLTDIEKTATIMNIMENRSGIYAESANETDKQKEKRPKRGAHKPGECYFYNNWDANVLGTILMNKTGTDLFIDFQKSLSIPLQMEDFRLMDGAYQYNDNSYFPAYSLKISSRDLARLGQLYVQNGMWNNNQIVPVDWIETSVTPHSVLDSGMNKKFGAGLFWETNSHPTKPYRYQKDGWGDHYLFVIPTEKLVIVIRSDTYFYDPKKHSCMHFWDIENVVETILDSKVAPPKENAELKPLLSFNSVKEIDLSADDKSQYVGSYFIKENPYRKYHINSNFEITFNGTDLIVNGLHYTGWQFKLLSIDNDRFIVEDLNMLIEFEDTDNIKTVKYIKRL